MQAQSIGFSELAVLKACESLMREAFHGFSWNFQRIFCRFMLKQLNFLNFFSQNKKESSTNCFKNFF